MRLVLWSVVFGVVVAACAVGPSATPSMSPSAAAGASVAPSPSGGASPTANASASAGPSAVLDEPVFTFDGDARRVRVYRPPTMPAGKVPLLLFLHPSGE